MAKSNSGRNTSTRDLWEKGYTPDQLALKIEDFIRGSVKRFDKNGVIIGLSGGIDSSVVSFLSVRALGKDRVFGLIMPERESSPKNIRDAEEIANSLEIKYEKIDLTPFLEELGVYKLVPPGISRSKLVLTKGLEIFKKRRGVRMIHSLGILGVATPDELSQRVTAIMLPKLRMRSLILYYHAALKDLLVVGTTNKTEYLLGHYDKYGDGACDIEPIRGLYKTEVRRLAEYLGVPGKIIDKPPTHDLFAGFILTDEAMMGMSFEKMDLILEKLERGEIEEKIAKELGIEIEFIKEVEKAIENQKINREMPFSPV